MEISDGLTKFSELPQLGKNDKNSIYGFETRLPLASERNSETTNNSD
jgi:hypothetical protein